MRENDREERERERERERLVDWFIDNIYSAVVIACGQ